MPLKSNQRISVVSSVFLLGLLFGILAMSCKPRVSLSGASIPVEAKTISVGIFKNNSSLGPPDLPQRFTERLRDLVSQQTNLALMAKNGDLQFDGYISDYNVASVAANGDQAAQNRLTIAVHVVFTNKYDKTKEFEQTFTRFADFASDRTINSVGPALSQEIFRQISEDIFYLAFNNW